jgi:hypothetical protein
MIIANPIYDFVFKYLPDDNRLARHFTGKLIGEWIEELLYITNEQVIPWKTGVLRFSDWVSPPK